MPTQAHPEEAPATADHISRRLWRALEPYHAVVYFMPDTRRRTDALGLKGGWMSYFGTRAAPLGPVPAEALVEARLAAADEGLRRLLGPGVSSAAVAKAAELASMAARATATAGRPLAAANSALPWPTQPHLRLWQAATILREARGDGHVASLVVAGLSPCEALVTASAAGGPPAELLRERRKWSQAEWDESVARLRSRGWLDERGALTDAGAAGRAAVERRTDELMKPTWDALGAEQAARLESLLLPIRTEIVAAGGLPVPNPLGLE